MGQRVGWGFANDENCSCHVQLWEQLSCTVCHQFPSCSLVLIRLSCKQQIRLIFFLNAASAQSELWILREKTKKQTRCLCSLRHESFANTVKAIKIAMFKQERWHTTITVMLLQSCQAEILMADLYEIRLGLSEAPGTGPASTFLPQHFFLLVRSCHVCAL